MCSSVDEPHATATPRALVWMNCVLYFMSSEASFCDEPTTLCISTDCMTVDNVDTLVKSDKLDRLDTSDLLDKLDK